MPYIKSNLESRKHNWNLSYIDRQIIQSNEASGKFYKMVDFLYEKRLSINSPFGAKRWQIVYEWFALLSYYVQSTAMVSQQESILKEISQIYNKDVILEYLKEPLTLTNPLAKVSQSLCNYIVLYDIAEVLLKPEYLEAMKQPHNKQHTDIILKIFYNNNIPKNATLELIFKKWQIAIEKFLTQICQGLTE